MNERTTIRLDLSMPPEWSRIDPTREAVGLLVMALFGDDDLRDALAMVSEELLENAVKYSKPDTVVSLSIRNEATRVVISVTNTVDERSQHLGTLRARVDWMRRFTNPGEAYASALASIAQRRDEPSDPGLGIVRIAYEGGCRIEVELVDDGMLTVRAVCDRQARSHERAPQQSVS